MSFVEVLLAVGLIWAAFSFDRARRASVQVIRVRSSIGAVAFVDFVTRTNWGTWIEWTTNVSLERGLYFEPRVVSGKIWR